MADGDAAAFDAGRAARDFARAFDAEVFLRALREERPERAGLPPPADPMALYLSEPALARLDANALFDERWYRRAHPDVEEAVVRGEAPSALYHFVAVGWREGRLPTYAHQARAELAGEPGPEPDPDAFEPDGYLRGDPEAQVFLRHFPHLTPLDYARTVGRRLAPAGGAAAAGRRGGAFGVHDLIRAEFDEEFYFSTYLAREEAKPDWADPFEHYLRTGLRKGYSPNGRFSETWYTAYYADVREAVAAGRALCGFHHYVVTGRAEGRSPKFDLGTALEDALPGVTEPTLLERSRALAARLAPTPCRVAEDRPRTLWVVLPRLNPDISFGGYRACFELVAALKGWCALRGLRLSVLTLEEGRANLEYFLWRTSNPRLRRAFADLEVRARQELDHLEIGSRDRFLAYSSWDVIFASPLAALTDEPRVVSLVQEYEPVFHEYGSVRAVTDWAFELPAYPVFNSRVLRDHFATERLGLFKVRPDAEEGRDYAVFEHVINRLPGQSASDMRGRRTRNCAVYARPEGHAARNLYELAELALKDLCARGRFDARWSFTGLGCLTPTAPVELGGGRRLEFVPKMSEEAYAGFVRQLDLGISLMYAPHPSVIPFEFATTGALVVTNTFSNRPARWYAGFSDNIVPCEPTLPAVTAAIEAALDRVDDFDARAAAALTPANADWPQVFDAAWLDETVGPVLR